MTLFPASSGGTSGATPTVGQGTSNAKQYGPGVGKQGNVSGNVNASSEETMDKDGSLLVPTYRGVWVNTEGKYFVKVDGNAVTTASNEGDVPTVHLFASADEASKHFDMLVSEGGNSNIELNFRKDGGRIVYEDASSMPNVSRGLDALGGGAISVVPALSVINIKVGDGNRLACRYPTYVVNGAHVSLVFLVVLLHTGLAGEC